MLTLEKGTRLLVDTVLHMVFSSLSFIFLFLPLFMILYFILDRLFRNSNLNNVLIIASSIIFYWWGAGRLMTEMLLILMVLDFILGQVIRVSRSRVVLALSVLLNAGILLRYKYPQQFIDLFRTGENKADLIIPLGASFIIFHLLSYLVDLYRESRSEDDLGTKGNRNIFLRLIDFSTYVLFFPKLIQGPIVRFVDMEEEIIGRRTDLDRLVRGMERFIIGLSMKVLIADVFGRLLSQITTYKNYDSVTAFLIIIVYSLDLYVDFSAYSSMAIGIAHALGFSFSENFSFPYRSTSITEFWRRWHISLGTWFRNYVYIPLGGSRKGNVYFNLAVVFILTGIWHGNTRIYFYWGILHGIFVLLERTPLFRKLDIPKRAPIIGLIYTNIVVWLGWLCFKFPTSESFREYLKHLKGATGEKVIVGWQYLFDRKIIILIIVSLIGSFLLNERVLESLRNRIEASVPLTAVKYMALLLLLFTSYAAMISNGFAPFLYFQF